MRYPKHAEPIKSDRPERKPRFGRFDGLDAETLRKRLEQVYKLITTTFTLKKIRRVIQIMEGNDDA